MSDIGRKGLGEQASEKMTPDSQKSTTDKISENASGVYDRAASAVQPEGQKSAGQKVGDSVRGGSDETEQQGKGVLGQAQDSLNSAGETISNTLSGKK